METKVSPKIADIGHFRYIFMSLLEATRTKSPWLPKVSTWLLSKPKYRHGGHGNQNIFMAAMVTLATRLSTLLS